MPVDPLNTWKSTLASLPSVSDASWSISFSSWYASRIIGISPDPSVFLASGFLFTFNTALFATGLVALPPVPTTAAGVLGFAAAWEAAILASVVIVGPGSALLPSSPATLFSVVAATIIDPTSIVLAKAKLMELATAAAVSDAMDSEFPVKFREATLLLSISVTGVNSIVPVPTPLVAPFIPLV